MKRQDVVRFVLPPILWASAIFIGSSIPAEDFPSLTIFSYDKLLHLGVYLVLAVLTHRAFIHQDWFPSVSRHAFLWTGLIIALYAASDELHQFLVPGRTPDVFDWLADIGGALLAMLLVAVIRKVRPIDI